MAHLKTLPGFADISNQGEDESGTASLVSVENESQQVEAKDRLMKEQPANIGKVDLVALADLELPDALEDTIAKWCDSIGVGSGDPTKHQIREESLIRHHFAGQCILRINLPDGVRVFLAGSATDDEALKLASELCDKFNERQDDCRIQFPKPIAD